MKSPVPFMIAAIEGAELTDFELKGASRFSRPRIFQENAPMTSTSFRQASRRNCWTTRSKVQRTTTWNGPKMPSLSHKVQSFNPSPKLATKSRLQALTIASALLLCAMAGCGSSHDNIVGKWRAAGDSSTMVWEFSKDGSVLMGSTRGKYSFGDRDRVKIQTPFGTSVYQIEFSGDRMILKDPSGSKLEFMRLK